MSGGAQRRPKGGWAGGHSPLLPQQLLADEDQLARGVVGLAGHGLQLGLQAPLLLQEGIHLLLPRLTLALQRWGRPAGKGGRGWDGLGMAPGPSRAELALPGTRSAKWLQELGSLWSLRSRRQGAREDSYTKQTKPPKHSSPGRGVGQQATLPEDRPWACAGPGGV